MPIPHNFVRDLHSYPSQEFSLLAFWRTLVIRRAVIVWTVLGALLVSIAVSLCMSRKYDAKAQLEFNPENTAALDVSSESMPPTEDYVVTLATQASVLQSDTLALQVIEQCKLEPEQPPSRFSFFYEDEDSLPLAQSPRRRTRLLKQFHKRLSVHAIGGTRILEVQYLDRNPAVAAAVVNTLVNDYLEQYFQTRYSATRQASNWLSSQLDDLRSDVTVSQQRLADYQKQTGILGESETNNVVMAKLEDINRQLSAAEANRIVKQAVWQLAKTGDPELISSVAGSSFLQGVGGGANPSQLGLLPTLRAQEAQLKGEIAETSARLGPAFPKLVQLRSQLVDLQSSISAEIAKIAARAQNDYLAAKNSEDMERALFDKQKSEANRLNDSAVQYGILKREADASRDLYQGLLGKLKQAGVLAGLHSSNIVIIDPARIPAKPSSPNYPLNLVLGLAAGLVAGVGVALIKDGTDTTIHTPQDLQRLVDIPVLGVIPSARPGSLNAAEVEEQFRALRTSLFSSNDGDPQVVLVTSALPCEGKTAVSVGLAKVLAQQAGRGLLVDADMRRPSVHHALSTRCGSRGLSELLNGNASDLIPEDLGDGFHVLFAGERPKHPAELLASKSMAKLIDEWRSDFDWIIFDTPPLLSVTDAAVLARRADAVLLIARADQTTGNALLRSAELLGNSHAPVSGIVLNAMDCHSAAYSYYYGHSYAAKQNKDYSHS